MDSVVLDHAGIQTSERVVIMRDPGMTQRIETLRSLNSDAAIDSLPVVDAEAVFTYREVVGLARCCSTDTPGTSGNGGGDGDGGEELPIIELIHLPNMRFLSLDAEKCPKDLIIAHMSIYGN